MFPIPWNFPLRKKNGNLVNIGDAIDEGTELPEHGEGDAGKVLSVDENGDLEWSDDVNSEIQTLTNNLSDEVSARAKLGAHNIFPITIESLKSLNTTGTWSDNSYTLYGITYACEVSNGYVTKITVTGTATATSVLDLFGKNNSFATNKFKGNILSGSPSGGSGTSYCIVEQTSASSAGTSAEFSIDSGSGAIIGDNDYARLYIRIENGYAISGSLVYNPMIRLATDSDSTHQPYAMSNRELTNKLLKYVEVENVTTGADGFFALNSNSIGGHIVSCISYGSHLILPGALAIYNNNEENYFVSLNPSTLAKEASTNIGSVRVYYIPIN